MRLFIAINFNEDVKKQINSIIEEVNKYKIKGRFTSKEHIHLTLEFLGDIIEERKKDIISAMENLDSAPFSLTLSHLGYFKRRDGNIYWLGIDENKDLIDVQKNLHKLLLERGFKLEEREYKAHITIGRRVKLEKSFNPQDYISDLIRKIQIDVKTIDLMQSERQEGKLVYTKLFSKSL